MENKFVISMGQKVRPAEITDLMVADVVLMPFSSRAGISTEAKPTFQAELSNLLNKQNLHLTSSECLRSFITGMVLGMFSSDVATDNSMDSAFWSSKPGQMIFVARSNYQPAKIPPPKPEYSTLVINIGGPKNAQISAASHLSLLDVIGDEIEWEQLPEANVINLYQPQYGENHEIFNAPYVVEVYKEKVKHVADVPEQIDHTFTELSKDLIEPFPFFPIETKLVENYKTFYEEMLGPFLLESHIHTLDVTNKNILLRYLEGKTMNWANQLCLTVKNHFETGVDGESADIKFTTYRSAWISNEFVSKDGPIVKVFVGDTLDPDQARAVPTDFESQHEIFLAVEIKPDNLYLPDYFEIDVKPQKMQQRAGILSQILADSTKNAKVKAETILSEVAHFEKVYGPENIDALPHNLYGKLLFSGRPSLKAKLVIDKDTTSKNSEERGTKFSVKHGNHNVAILSVFDANFASNIEQLSTGGHSSKDQLKEVTLFSVEKDQNGNLPDGWKRLNVHQSIDEASTSIQLNVIYTQKQLSESVLKEKFKFERIPQIDSTTIIKGESLDAQLTIMKDPLKASKQFLNFENDVQIAALVDSTLSSVMRVYHPIESEPTLLGLDRDMNQDGDRMWMKNFVAKDFAEARKKKFLKQYLPYIKERHVEAKKTEKQGDRGQMLLLTMIFDKDAKNDADMFKSDFSMCS